MVKIDLTLLCLLVFDIEFKLLSSAEDQQIADEQDKLKRATNSPLEKNVTTKYKHQITSVDGKDDPSFY